LSDGTATYEQRLQILNSQIRTAEDTLKRFEGVTTSYALQASKLAQDNLDRYEAERRTLVQLISDEQRRTAAAAEAAVVIAENEEVVAVAYEEEVRRNGGRKTMTKELMELEAEAARAREEASKAYAAAEISREEKIKAKRLESIQSLLYSSSLLFGGISSLVSASYQNQIDAAEEGSEKQKELMEKQWEAEKAFAVTQSLISTALGITRAIPNIPLMIFAGAAGAFQTAAILAQKKPAFADGTPTGGYVVPPGYNGDDYPVTAKSGETVNITRAGEGGGQTEIVIMLDGLVLARTMTDLIGSRQVVIRQEDIVA
jgi:hypothetical protein